MKAENGLIVSLLSSYWKVFRLVFVIFSLYLMGDVFYRWDGFKYYASFSEFLPNVSLVAIFWSIIAILSAVLVWLPIRMISFFCRYIKWNNAQRLFEFAYIFVSVGAVMLIMKRIIWSDVPLPPYVKLIIILVGTLAALFIDWLLHSKFELIQNRITPLVWIFGLFVIMSVPLVGYHMYHTTWQQKNEKVYQELILSSEANITRPNIIFITFDALTTKDMSAYGYHRPTTPYIAEWAKQATLFTGLKASSNWTVSTISSLLSGKRPWTHRVFQPHAYKIDKGVTENLPRLLKQNGYYNMAYLANLLAPYSSNGIDDYFDVIYKAVKFRHELNIDGFIELKIYEYFGDAFSLADWIMKPDFIFGKFMGYVSGSLLKRGKGSFYYDLEKMFDTLIDDIDKNPPEPFYARMHIWQPHAPYLPPKSYEGMFGPLNQVGWSRDRYDELIRYCDEEFKAFINDLTIKGKLKNTVIIVSSDHGESFEHGYHEHGGPYLYEQVTSIPLIIMMPEKAEGQVIDELVEQIDIPATILDLAHIPVPTWMEGRSLMPLMQGKKRTERPVFSMNFEQNPFDAPITKGVVAV
jgi:arylsulfatase A-like enzyme